MARISLRDYQRALAERLKGAEAGAGASRLGVQAGAERWLVSLADAGEVIPAPAITPVPLAKAWFRGVANVRGKLYGVVDLPAFLGGAPAAPGEQARLLLLSDKFRMGSALLVDRVLGLRGAEGFEPQAAAGGAPWLKAEFVDRDGVRWKELDVPRLVQEAAFLDVAA